MIAGLLVAQATAFVVWWAVLLIVPSSRAYFQPTGGSTPLVFWLADAAVIVTTFAAAFAVMRGRRWAGIALWAAAGGTAYAALYCLAASIATGSAGLAVVFMVPSAVLAIALARAGARA